MTDTWRSGALVCAAVLQVLAAAVWGKSVGGVANSYPTLLLPAGAAFSIWSLIYVGFAAMAVRQASQRGRDVHRRTGWWLVAAGVLNAAWVPVFTNRWILLAQVVIVALLVCLVSAALRLQPADGWGDRLLLHIPVTVYLGWVVVATVAGAATTAAAFGAAPGVTAAIVSLALTGVAAALAVLRLPAVVGFAAAVCWALTWIAANTPTMWVRVTALIAIAVVGLSVVVRIDHKSNRGSIAWG